MGRVRPAETSVGGIMAPISADDGAPGELDTLHEVDSATTGETASAFAVGGLAGRRFPLYSRRAVSLR